MSAPACLLLIYALAVAQVCMLFYLLPFYYFPVVLRIKFYKCDLFTFTHRHLRGKDKMKSLHKQRQQRTHFSNIVLLRTHNDGVNICKGSTCLKGRDLTFPGQCAVQLLSGTLESECNSEDILVLLFV